LKELAYLNKYFFKYKKYFLGGIVFTIISNLFGIIPAQMVREALDTVKISLTQINQNTAQNEVIHGEIIQKIAYFGLLILAMAILKGIFLFAVRQTLIVMSRHVEYDLKNEIYAHYQTLPQSFYKTNQTGDLMARISEDVGKVRMYIGPSLMYLLNMVVLVVLILSYMFSVNVRLTLFVLIPMPVLSLSIYLVSSTMNKKSELIQKSLAKVSVFSQEAFSGIRIIKSFNREPNFIQNFESESLNYRKHALSLTKIDSLFSPVVGFLIGLCTVLCVYIGGQEVMAGKLTNGNIAEFIIYVFMLTWPLTALGWTSGQIQRAAASQKRINEFLKNKTEIVSAKNLEVELAGNIEFKNVSFTYPETGITALDNISFQIKKGQKIAIIGSTGSGKSTLASLLFRMYDCTAGQINYEGINIQDIKVSSLREQIAYVPQDVFLFSDTISNNIKFGKNEADKSEIETVAKAAEVHKNILDFENGYETMVGERGITLSGGQKQRISIARALIKQHAFIIFDDCLSAVDTKTESQILNNIYNYTTQSSSLIISHRVSNAKMADYILVLDNGKIVEQGTHDNLLAKNGEYKNLYDLQYSEELI
jgi:ATP-binding cassette, subfamily B, multidrug efflux pump